MSRARKNTPGMNMRDMKRRSMAHEKRLSSMQRLRSNPDNGEGPVTPRDDEDPFERAVHVDQGDGIFAATSGYDGGGEGESMSLPDAPPPGWWD
jgi:hypothetical protein